MKPGAHVLLLAAARFYAPLIVLVALTILVLYSPGTGVGFVAGLIFAMAIVVHALVFGAGAARIAFPPWLARVLIAAGLLLCVAGAAAPALLIAPQLTEGGLFAVTAAGVALIMTAIVGRAPTLRDEEA
jgi:multisubunit Na+/H+ antiporter MnhB subunit